MPVVIPTCHRLTVLGVPFTTVWDHSNGFEPGFPNTSRVIPVFCSSIHLNYPVYRFRAPMSCWFTDSTLEAFSVCHSHFGVVRIPGVLRDTTGPSPSVRLHRFDRRGWTFLRHHHPSVRNWSESKIQLLYTFMVSIGILSMDHHLRMDRHGLPWIPMAVAQILAWMYEGPSWAFPLLDWGSLCCPCFFGMKIASTGLWHTHELK